MLSTIFGGHSPTTLQSATNPEHLVCADYPHVSVLLHVQLCRQMDW
jgi:hypothetical protein